MGYDQHMAVTALTPSVLFASLSGGVPPNTPTFITTHLPVFYLSQYLTCAQSRGTRGLVGRDTSDRTLYIHLESIMASHRLAHNITVTSTVLTGLTTQNSGVAAHSLTHRPTRALLTL